MKYTKRFGGLRQIAREAGKVFFRTGVPCKRGHIANRWVSSNACVECTKEHNQDPTRAHKRLFYQARTRAKRDGILFDIAMGDVLSVWPADDRCPIFSTPFEYVKPSGRGKWVPNPKAPTLDRIIPNKGYVKGNIAILSYRANLIKNDCLDPHIFRQLAFWLETHLTPKVKKATA